MLLTSEVHNAVTKYCPSLVNWIVERDMNQKFNHQTYYVTLFDPFLCSQAIFYVL
jgi:hypothetical protein